MSLSLKLMGGLTLADERGPLGGPAVHRHRLALLAILAASSPRAVSRDKLMAWLWPEREEERARQLLNQAVHAVRRALGPEVILPAGEELQFNPALVRCDVVEFEAALAAGDRGRAVALYFGPFLDGFNLDDAPAFGHWVDRERDRLAAACAKALEGLAADAEDGKEWNQAAEWWKLLAAHDPYDTRVALRAMRALERAGSRAGAIQLGAAHQQRLRDDLELEPDAEVGTVMDRLRREQRAVTTPRPPAAAAASPSLQVADAAASPVHPEPPQAPWVPAPTSSWRRAFRHPALLLVVAAGLGIALWAAWERAGRGTATSPQVVDEFVEAVARELARREGGDTGRVMPHHRTRSIAAYELYQRGNDPAMLRSDSAARRALDYFQRAVGLDSGYAAAWAGVARMKYRLAASSRPDTWTRDRMEAEASVHRALALDSSFGEGYVILAVMRAGAWQVDSAEAYFRRAIALEPARGWFRELLSQFYLATGRPAEALAEAERGLALGPLSPSAIAELARSLCANGRVAEGLERLASIADLEPPLARAAPIGALCHARQENWPAAIALMRPTAERGDPSAMALAGYLLARGGNREEALAFHERLEQQYRDGTIGAYYLSFVPAALGDVDQAFAHLDRAFEDGSMLFAPGRVASMLGLPFDDLRGDPRYDGFRTRLRLQNR